MNSAKMYQVSTLQALALGYTRSVIKVGELLEHGGIGLGTFKDVNGEMIVAGGNCYRAMNDGTVEIADPDMGVPFASVTQDEGGLTFELENISGIDALKDQLTLKVEEGFGLNSMHVASIHGTFSRVCARSEMPYESQHIHLKDILSKTQQDFEFTDIDGTLVCVYYPDFMDGINLPGWHIHFVSDDHKMGGHVFDINMVRGDIRLIKISSIEIRLPSEPAFDTYALKQASGGDIKKVEQKQ